MNDYLLLSLGKNTNDLPFVTEVITIRNEAASIELSLRAVVSQEYLADFMQVIVIDGMFDDNTKKIVGVLQSKYSQIKMVDILA